MAIFDLPVISRIFVDVSIDFTTCYHFIYHTLLYAEMDGSNWNSENCSLREYNESELKTFQLVEVS